MRRVKIADYIQIGVTFGYLRDIAAGTPIHGEEYTIGQLDRFLDQLKSSGLIVTRAVAEPLVPIRASLQAEPQGTFLSDEKAKSIRNCLQQLQSTLLAEAGQREVFEAEATRFQTRDLLDDVRRLLANGIFEKLSPISQRDFSESAKCLVLGRATASAFHILRCTESEMRELYLRCAKRNRIREPRLWGPMVQDLRARRTSPSADVLDRLDHIRKFFRNPTQHPEAEYTLDEAQDLFSLCSEILNRIVNHAGG